MAEMIPFGESQDKKREEQAPEAKPAASPSREDSRRYSNEEVSEIIRVALRKAETAQTDSVDHEEMLAIGRDFGLGPEDISRAFDEIHRDRSEKDLESQAVLWFKLHALTFGVVMAGLFALNMLTGTSDWWALYPAIPWGCVVIIHGVLTRYIPAISLVIVERTGKMARESMGGEGDINVSHGALTFTVPDDVQGLHGLAQTKGMLHLEEDALIIESQTKDSILGLIKGDIKEIRIPYGEIASVKLQRQFWSTRLILHSHRLKTFEKVAHQDGGRLVLCLDKNSREHSEHLVRDLANRIG